MGWLTTALDVVGAICLCVFAWFVWPAAAFAVAGVLILAASWRLSSGGPDS